MTPVCPACRASLTLDAYACWRCGLSVRPTCARCGEPLAHGMTACWFCREPVTEPDPSQEMAVARAATAFTSRPPVVEPAPPPAPTPVPPPPPAPTPEVTAPIAPVDPPLPVAPVAHGPVEATSVPAPSAALRAPRRTRWGRVVLLGLLGGALLTAGALAYESLWIRHLPPDADDVVLSRASFTDIGCIVAYPQDWQTQETKRRVTFLSVETAKDRTTRGFRVSSTDIPFSRVDDQIEQLPDRFGAYTALDTFSGAVDGEPATVHVFVADDLRFELWWIDRGERSLRVDLWSRPAHEEASALNRRIVESITLL